MRPKDIDRIERLKDRRAQIDAEIIRLEAKEKTQARKLLTRMKILVGACVLVEMQQDAEVNSWIADILSRRLTRSRDRALFDLPSSDLE